MKFYMRFNGNKYSVIPQVKAVDKQNSELNMYEFTLSTLTKEIDLDYNNYNGLVPIHLIMDKGTSVEDLPLYVTYYHKQVVAYNPKKYKYVIQATSPLFALQRIILPNRLITQPIDENANKKTIYGEISKLIEVYAPDFYLDANLKNEEGMKKYCPEMQFTKSTLYEALVALFQVAGLVPRMNNSFTVISYASINGTNNNWNSSDIFIREETSNSVANYADMLDIDIENAISKTEDISTAWIAPTSEEAALTTENFEWELPTDIYELEEVDLIGPNITYSRIPKDGGMGEVVTLDYPIPIKYWIVPKAVYDTLKTSNSIQILEGREWKRNYLYYDGNKISGGGYSEGTWFGFDGSPAIMNVVQLTLDYLEGLLGNSAGGLKILDIRKLMIKVKYKSENDNTRVKIIKNGINKPFNGLINNQDDSYIDTLNFGNKQQELVNRMGNEEVIGQAHFNYENRSYFNSPQVGDRVDIESIISEREILMQEKTMLVNYTLAKKYVFETGFSGLNQVKRFTQIDKEGTLIRNDNFLYNFQLSTEKNGVDDYLVNRLIDNYGENQYNGVCLHYYQARLSEATSQSAHLLLESQNKHIADSILCQMGFNHNYVAGNRVGYEDKKTPIMQPVRYTNKLGEFKYARIYFGGAEEERFETNYDQISRYPEATPQASSTPSTDFLLYKDTREISNFTFQFRMLNGNDTFVYDKFLDYTQLTTHAKEELKVYILYDKNPLTTKYDENSTIPLGIASSDSVEFGKDGTRTITINNVLFEFGYYAIGVTDSKDNLLFAVNYENKQSATASLTLWVNEIK